MRRKAVYIHDLEDWPNFEWDAKKLANSLAQLRFRQGKLLGKMEGLGFDTRKEANLQTLTEDVLKSSDIEGEVFDPNQVRSSVARKLGLKVAGMVPSARKVDGAVEMLLDATQKYTKELSEERLFAWHKSLFSGGSAHSNLVIGKWRTNDDSDPMMVVSGALGKEKVHFQAPVSSRVKKEMKHFLKWFNNENDLDLVLKSALAHLWFLTIHPFDDGNGRIARAISDLLLCRADNNAQRFYSMSGQIRQQRKAYYEVLEKTQKGRLDITEWLLWYMQCMQNALLASENILSRVLKKARFWDIHRNAVLNERQHLMLNKLLDGFDGKLTTSKWAKITKTSQDSALRDIQDLITRKVLEKETSGGRSTSYILKAL